MEHVVSEAASTLPYTMALHASSRIMTFMLNSALLRLVSHDVLGLANVRLQLLFTTISFIAREPFRRALPAGESLAHHQNKKLSPNNWSIVRTSFLCPLLAFLVTVPITLVWLYLLEEPPAEFVETYYVSTLIYALSAFLEAFAEPAASAAHLAADFRLRMKAEGVAVAIRTILTVVFTYFLIHTQEDCQGCELYCFALAQLLSSVFYAGWMWLSTIPLMKNSQDHAKKHDIPLFDPVYLRLSVSFLAHSIVKQLLTEGERYVMAGTTILTFAEQGVYDVVNNLGSLVARLVFLPLEDTSYLVFQQMMTREHKSSAADMEAKVSFIFPPLLDFIHVDFFYFFYSPLFYSQKRLNSH